MSHSNKINPLDILDIRRLEWLPEDFTTTKSPLLSRKKQLLEDWIKNNTKGKYFIGNDVWLTEDKKLVQGFCIGFEKSGEHTLFLLACPYLK